MAVDLHRLMPPKRDRFGIAWICVASLALSQAGTAGSAHAQSRTGKAKESVKAQKADPADDAAADSGLPPGYDPPRDPPEIMLEEKNLLTPEEREQFKKELNNNYSRRFRTGDIRSEEAKQGIRNGIRYRLNELTIAKNRRELPKIRERMIQDLRQAGTVGNLKVDQLREFRRQLLTMIVEETEKLFDNNELVRIQAAIMLGELNLMEEDAAKGISREAFAGAAKPLNKVLLDPEQPEAVKIGSVLSLIRILRQGSPTVEQKRDIATAVVSELKRTDTHAWYQDRLAEALGSIDVSLDLNRNPFVFNVLDAVLKDRKRDLQVRAQAACSLGRHPLTPQVDLPRLAAEIALVGYDLAQAHAAAPGNARWKRCTYTLYSAFHAKDKLDLEATRQRPSGLLNYPPAAAPAKEAYGQLLPIIVPILINGERVAPEQIQSLGKWLESRLPKDQSTGKKPADTPMGNGGPE